MFNLGVSSPLLYETLHDKINGPYSIYHQGPFYFLTQVAPVDGLSHIVWSGTLLKPKIMLW